MRTSIKIILFATFISSVILSCDETKKNTKVFNLLKSDFSDWAGLIQITDSATLQETDSCIISYADKCISSRDTIYFWDHKMKAIYCFNKDGKYVRTIGNRGRSASEYMDIKDMQINEKEATLNILDVMGILTYDLHSGKFMNRKKFSSSNSIEYERFAIVGKDSFLCFTDNRNKYSIVLDTPQKKSGLRESKRFHFVTNTFYSFNNKCKVLADYGDFYIEEYTNGKLIPVYEINLGDKALPDDIRPKTFKEFEIVDGSQDYFKCITNAYETSRWLYLLIIGPNQTYYQAFINKETGKYAFGTAMSISVIGADEDSFYALIYPELLPEDSFIWNIISSGFRPNKQTPIFIKFRINENKI